MFQIVIHYINGCKEGKAASEFCFNKIEQVFYININNFIDGYEYEYHLLDEESLVDKIEVFSGSETIFSIGYKKSENIFVT